MPKGTIIYIGAFELPDKDAAAHRVLNNAKLLKELGYKTVFMDVDRSDKQFKDFDHAVIQGFDVWSVKFPRSVSAWLKYLTSIRSVKRVVDKYSDVKAIICYNYQTIPLYKLIGYGRKNNIKIIGDITEWYEDQRMIKKLDTEFRMKYVNKHMDGLICISSYLERYYGQEAKTVIIPPLVDLNEEKWESKSIERKSDVLNLVYSGSPGKHKDKLNLVVEAINKIKDNRRFDFKIIGISKQQYIDYYPKHKSILEEIKSVIRFMGRVSHDESLDYVKQADFHIFIRESKRVNNAGFPTKFVESMACGTPVLTTPTSDIGTHLKNGVNGYLIEDDKIDSIELSLNKILELKKDDIVKMKANCLNTQGFDYNEYTTQMESFLHNILNN